MQYKIPIQVENEDPIILGLSIRQLAILIAAWWLAYWIFKLLVNTTGWQIALLPSWLIVVWTFILVKLNYYGMTFLPLVLAFLQYNINIKNRFWIWWVDSYSVFDTWIITLIWSKKEDTIIDLSTQEEKLKNLEDNLSKI